MKLFLQYTESKSKIRKTVEKPYSCQYCSIDMNKAFQLFYEVSIEYTIPVLSKNCIEYPILQYFSEFQKY